jgi:ethanolamine permease
MPESVDGRSELESEGGSVGREKQENIGKVDVFLLGVTAVLSGQVTAWAAATAHGFWVLLACTLIPTVGYLILTFCVAEMTSALPFSGGIYGFVRAFSSPLLGFIVAMFEIIVNLCYVSPTVYLLASIPSDYYNVSQSFKLPLCLIIYIALDVILLAGGTLFWQFNRYLGLLVLVLFVTYIIGSATYADFDKWGKGDEFDVPQLFQDLPLVSTVYLGIQLLPLSSRLTSKPKKDVPIAMNTMMVVGCMITISLICTSCSQYPGIDLSFD